MTDFTINAEGKKLGRVASEAAAVLLGKKEADYAPNRVASVTVHIINISKLDILETKMTSKLYPRYSGYPGGLRFRSMRELNDIHGQEEIMRKAVYNMLPSNRLRSQRMKNLILSK